MKVFRVGIGNMNSQKYYKVQAETEKEAMKKAWALYKEQGYNTTDKRVWIQY